jgi:hypothetical protein
MSSLLRHLDAWHLLTDPRSMRHPPNFLFISELATVADPKQMEMRRSYAGSIWR